MPPQKGLTLPITHQVTHLPKCYFACEPREGTLAIQFLMNVGITALLFDLLSGFPLCPQINHADDSKPFHLSTLSQTLETPAEQLFLM